MGNSPFVSIVIPVYNEEKYLSKCIESVLSQTYTNWECIIVNNCSTDSSFEIAKNYEKRDSRIRVLNNINFLNQLQNMNGALKNISHASKYCKMVLGDDFLFPECIEKMVEVAESDPSVGIVSSYRLEETKVTNEGLPFGKPVFDGREIGKSFFLHGYYVFGTQTSVLYKSEIVLKKQPFFNESSLGADTDVCLEILQEYNFGFINQVLTFTRRENETERSRMQKYDPRYPLRKLVSLVKFGKSFLSEEEYFLTYGRMKENYYRFLAAKYFTNRENRFWEFHENALEQVKLKIEKGTLYKYAAIVLLDKILNPKKTFEDIFLNKKYFNQRWQ